MENFQGAGIPPKAKTLENLLPEDEVSVEEKATEKTAAQDRHLAILPIRRPGNILIDFHKREMMPMKSCPDCKATGILALNGMFGCPTCRHYFK